jgi:hypothetical protein
LDHAAHLLALLYGPRMRLLPDAADIRSLVLDSMHGRQKHTPFVVVPRCAMLVLVDNRPLEQRGNEAVSAHAAADLALAVQALTPGAGMIVVPPALQAVLSGTPNAVFCVSGADVLMLCVGQSRWVWRGHRCRAHRAL